MATLLLIDDDPAVRDLLKMLFSETHECHTADRAEQALEFLELQDYDVVITDVSMPGLGGVEVLQHVRQRDRATPVIVISGRPDEYQEAVLEMGAFAFFAKPFSLSAIEASVNGAIAEARTARLYAR
ncbi:MAG TPA: response regulator [Pyrinomonadaceae bacterium]|nr:response regulator [Pyrinomonadaceae bacterium]